MEVDHEEHTAVKGQEDFSDNVSHFNLLLLRIITQVSQGSLTHIKWI